MSLDYELTDENKEERRSKWQEKQYDIVSVLGWKSFGVAFLVMIVGLGIYGVFF